jgi:hypothetical protein
MQSFNNGPFVMWGLTVCTEGYSRKPTVYVAFPRQADSECNAAKMPILEANDQQQELHNCSADGETIHLQLPLKQSASSLGKSAICSAFQMVLR